MSKSTRFLPVVAMLVAIGWAGASHAQAWYSLSTAPGASGGQAQIGGGLPLPIQAATTMSMSPPGGPIGTGTMFPPLLIPVNKAKAAVKQTAGADPKQITVPVGTFKRVPTAAKLIGVALNNPTVYQVRSNIEFSGPAPVWGNAVMKAGGRTGAKTTTFVGIPGTAFNPSTAKYFGSAAQFGGPSRTRVNPLTVVRAWAHKDLPGASPPCKHPLLGGGDADCISAIVEAHPMTLAVAGAKVASPADTTPGGIPMTMGAYAVSVPKVTGLIGAKVTVAMSGASNMATSSGFPWTTGALKLVQPSAAGTPETFTITGMDTRMGGVGTLSLVSGALSDRLLSGPNSNRSWSRYVITPEPGAVLGAATALAVLALCHVLVRRRR